MDKNFRITESMLLIRNALIKSHDDGDENSLFVRFAEIEQHIEKLHSEIKSLNSVLEIINHGKEL